MYRMFRIFCATAWELEGERIAFCDDIGRFNEAEAMKANILYVPVCLLNMRDKRPLQYSIEQNIRDSSYYILCLSEDWGPKERNFARDYRLALQCRDDASLPMRHTQILLRTDIPGRPHPFAAELAKEGFSCEVFSTMAEFQQILHRLLSEWLPADAAAGAQFAHA